MTDKHLVGDNSHGYINESLLVSALDGKYYKDLNTHLKKFIRQI